MRIALSALIATTLLSACATEGTSILIGANNQHPPIDPQKVIILLRPPETRHEIVALVEGVASTDDYLSEKRTQDAAVMAMKKEAAKLGAQAIVLTEKGRTPYAQMTVGNAFGSGTAATYGQNAFGSSYFTSIGTTMGFEKIRVSGTAIYIAE